MTSSERMRGLERQGGQCSSTGLRDLGEIGILLFQQTGVKLRINVDLSKEGNVGNHEGTSK